jgi:hypothetical protein
MKKFALLLVLVGGCLVPASLPLQVRPLSVPDKTKGQIVPLPNEEPAVKKVLAKGVAKVFEGNVESARKAALRAAYAEAVAFGGGVEVGSLSLIRNQKYVSEVVLSRSRGFVRGLLILNEGLSKKAPDQYEVFIEAQVIERGRSLDSEIDGLRLYLEVLGNPQLLIILPESPVVFADGAAGEAKSGAVDLEFQDQDTRIKLTKGGTEAANLKMDGPPDKGTALRGAEAALAQAFSAYGYQVITADDLAGGHLGTADELQRAKAGDTDRILEIARRAGIDLALFGTLKLTREVTKPAGVDMTKVVAEASAKAVIVSSGRRVDVYHHTTNAAGFSAAKAYADCLNRVADHIAAVLAWKIPQMLANELRETRLILSPLTLKSAEEVKNALKAVSGVEEVRFARIPTTANPRAEIILLSGFVAVEPAEVLAKCEEILKTRLDVRKAGKFVIECAARSPQEKKAGTP